MKFSLFSSAILAVVSAQEPIPKAFPSDCTGDVTKCTGEDLCCSFKSTDGAHSLQRCLTPAKRSSAYTGSYTDDSQTKFTWTCPKPAEPAAKTGAHSL